MNTTLSSFSRRLIRHLVPNAGTIVLLALFVWAQAAGAFPFSAPQGPTDTRISYQGRLTGVDGLPLTGAYPMTVALYTVPTGGTPFWSETQATVSVQDGLFNVLLGSVVALPNPLPAGNLYLGVTVGNEEITPRQLLSSSYHALEATRAAQVPDGSIGTAQLTDGAVTSAKIQDAQIATDDLGDGAVTTGKIANGAVSRAKLQDRFPRLLGEKTCTNCGNATEWLPGNTYNVVKGNGLSDPIQVTVTSEGGPLYAHMTARFNMEPPLDHLFCLIEVSGQFPVHVSGNRSVDQYSVACSGSYLFTNLPAGTYTFRALVFVESGTTIMWGAERQLAVYEF